MAWTEFLDFEKDTLLIANMDIYKSLDIEPIINAQGHFTILGGAVLPAPVREAMDIAGQSFVDIPELFVRASQKIALLTKNEAACICNGSSSGLLLAALACMTRGDAKAIANLPKLEGLPAEFIIHRSHRIPPDLPVLLSGAKWKEIGTSIGTRPIELEAAINEQTAGIFYMPGEDFQSGTLSLEDTRAIAAENNIPLIVDAAAELPPADNLWYFTRTMGADLAVFSGGKALCGPQSSGFIVGRPDLIRACQAIGFPNTGIARAMKVGKEEICGLLAALEWFLSINQQDRQARVVAVLDYWERAFSEMPEIHPVRTQPPAEYQPEWRIRLEIDANNSGISAMEIRNTLWNKSPRIAVMVPPNGREIWLTPYTLHPGEETIVAEALLEVLSASRHPFERGTTIL